MRLAKSEFVCVLCEKTIEHSELIYKLIIGKSCLCHGCLADARLGRMVRRMPKGWLLERGQSEWRYAEVYGQGFSDGATPDEALERAGVEEVER